MVKYSRFILLIKYITHRAYSCSPKHSYSFDGITLGTSKFSHFILQWPGAKDSTPYLYTRFSFSVEKESLLTSRVFKSSLRRSIRKNLTYFFSLVIRQFMKINLNFR